MPTAGRHARQILLPQIGEAGQKRLSQAALFVVGCGGLGSALLYDLTAMGVGRIGFADDDAVSESDLNRQFLYTTADIGRKKAPVTAERLSALDPGVTLAPVCRRVTAENAAALVDGYDAVLLAVDNLETRLAVNAACHRLGLPLIDGGVDGFHGSMTLVVPEKTACLACLYGDAPKKSAPKKRPIAAFAPVVTAISALEAQAAALTLLGLCEPLLGKTFFFDGGSLTLDAVRIRPVDGCPVCG